MELLPEDAKTSAAISALRKTGNQRVSVAYRSTAHLGQVTDLRQVLEEGKEIWILQIQPNRNGYGGGITEMAFENYSADDIAELRARRILLDEDIPAHGRTSRDQINKSMLASLVEGIQVPLQIKGSPFPGLYKSIGDDSEYFLAACRLFGVLFLRLSGVVEQVFKLELSLGNATILHVDFEGQRRHIYQNTDPPVIRVEGNCNLA